MRRQRIVLMSTGASMATAVAILAALLLPSTPKPVRHHAKCVQSSVISVEYVCGRNVIHVNPDGSRVVIGTTKQLRDYHPLPAKQAPRP